MLNSYFSYKFCIVKTDFVRNYGKKSAEKCSEHKTALEIIILLEKTFLKHLNNLLRELTKSFYDFLFAQYHQKSVHFHLAKSR